MNKIEADRYFEVAHRCLIEGDRVGALHYLQLGLLENPDHAAAWTNRGDILFQMSDPFEALISYDRALVTMPQEPFIHNCRGTCLQLLRRYDDALACYDRALGLDPDCDLALANKGALIQPINSLAAVELLRRAVAISPKRQEWHTYLGMSLLRVGALKEGWVEFEWRKKSSQHGTNGRRLTFPEWRGGSAGAVLLHGEQGFGDAIQFMRYAPIATKRFGVKVYLEVRPQLARLARTMHGLEGVIAVGDKLPDDITHTASLMSMPIICGTDTVNDIPAEPYLYQFDANIAVVDRWERRLSQLPSDFRVGICWAGGSHKHIKGAHEVDGRRSLDMAQLAPLASIEGISWVSLQTGPPALQARTPPEGMVIGAWPDDLDDFYDTASLIDHLDLVISVDTAVVHLAAAMGKPTWLLNRFDSCWRWMDGRTDSPWYPSLRQFRQPAWGDWDSVIKELGRALREKVEGTEHAMDVCRLPKGRRERS